MSLSSGRIYAIQYSDGVVKFGLSTSYKSRWTARGYPDGIPDESDLKIENAGKAPSWRRVCKTLLRNDYWCKYLGFSPTKTSAYQKYTDLMARRRRSWNIFNDLDDVAKDEASE